MPKLLDARKVPKLLVQLAKSYPNVTCALTHHDPFQLVAATILSAQCTDKRVNMVTPGLFARYPTPQAMAAADPAELEAMIRSTGFFRN
ncbi:MAG: endonuclease III, partial [Deltaproteobacteria bacterium]|nr:endonuclease III [Deltaproteobacteria bacterium]